MKKICLLSLIFALTFILSGCSYFSRFVIVNNSKDVIEIKYEAKNPGYSNLTPYFKSLKDFKSNEGKWNDLSEDRYKIDQEKGIVEVRLAPDEVLQIQSANAIRIQENPYEEFNLKSVKISGKNGLISLEGNQVFDAFKPETKGWSIIQPNYPTYIIYYK